MEPPRIKQPPRFNLFGLPAELRWLIYEIYFSYDEKPSFSPNIRLTGSHRAYPTPMLPLLQSSSVIFAEALPIFYQSFTFKIQTPPMASDIFPAPSKLSKFRWDKAIRPITPVLSRFTNLELQDIRMANPEEWDRILSPYVQCLLDYCPRLRFLKLYINKHPFFPRNSFEQRYPLPNSASLLAQLWKRLDCLEVSVSVLQCDDTSEGFRELIAPKQCWIRRLSVRSFRVGDYYPYKRAIWSLQPIAEVTKKSDQQEVKVV